MPNYQDQFCEGACERLGHKCIRPDLFTLVASEFKAVPKLIAGETAYMDAAGDTQVGQWQFYALDVQGMDRDHALHETTKKMYGDLGTADFDKAKTIVERRFLQEFPCHLECDITICGYCGQQHEDRYIHDGYCELAPMPDDLSY